VASPGKKSFLLRLDPQVWTQLERLAAADLRSVNAEVEFLLREGLKRRGLPATVESTSAAHIAGSTHKKLKGNQSG